MPPRDPRAEELGTYTTLLCDRCGKPAERESQNRCKEPHCGGRISRQRVRVYSDPRRGKPL